MLGANSRKINASDELNHVRATTHGLVYK
jgi:hypothetical protein